MKHFDINYYNMVLATVFLHKGELNVDYSEDMSKEDYVKSIIDIFRNNINEDICAKYGNSYVNGFMGASRFSKDLKELYDMKKKHELSKDLFFCATMYNAEAGYSMKDHAIAIFLDNLGNTLSQILDDLSNLDN